MLTVLLFFMTVGLFLCLDMLKPPYGVVFDVDTGEYIDTAIVMLVDAMTGKEFARTISDMHGRYYFFAPPGKYRIIVERTHFRSDYKLSPVALLYGAPYRGQIINHRDQSAISYSVAMNQVAPDWNHKNKLRTEKDTAGMSIIARWVILFTAVLVTIVSLVYFFNSYLLILGAISAMMLVWWGVFLFDHSPAHGIRHWGDDNYKNGYAAIFGRGNILVKKVPINANGNYWALVPPGKYTVRIYGIDNTEEALISEYKNINLKGGVVDRSLVEEKGLK